MINSATNKTNNTNKKITTKNTKKILNIKFMSFIIISTIIICLTSCNRKSSLESTITVVDSLGWQDELEYAFSSGSRLIADENELFIFSDIEILVYDTKTLQYQRTFGSKGKGPGEISSGWSFTFDKDENIVVCDFGNMRLHWFTKTGDYLKSIPAQLPWTVHCYNENIYFTNFSMTPEFSYKIVDKDSVNTVLNLSKICEKEGVPPDKRELTVIQENENIFIAFSQYKNHLYAYDSSNENNSLIKLKTPMDYENNFAESYVTSILTQKNSFFVIFCLYEKMMDVDETEDNSKDVKDKTGMREFLCEYSYEGQIIDYWKMPNHLYANSLSKSGNDFFIQDFFSGIVYKFRLN